MKMLLLAASAALFALPVPAQASLSDRLVPTDRVAHDRGAPTEATQDCLSPEGLLSHASEAVPIVDLNVTGALFDREIIVHFENFEFMWLFKDGCALDPLVPLGPVDPDAPPVTPQKAPVLHGGGEEIGS